MTLKERKNRPTSLEGQTEKVRTAHGNLYVTVNWDKDGGQPFEVFASLGKSGGCDRAYIEGVTRLVSLCLQYQIPIKEVTKQLRSISCHPFLLGNEEIGNTSPVDAIGHVLVDSYEDKEEEETPTSMSSKEENETV